MIYICLEGHDMMNAVQTTVQIFMPNEKYKPVDSIQEDGITVKSSVMGNGTTAQLYENGSLICEKTETTGGVTMQHAVRSAVYHMLKEKTGQHLPWGMLTGIRPAKTINTYMDTGLAKAESIKKMIETYEMPPEKAELAAAVATAERSILEKADKNGISLYIGIPFCPTRCLYCSFTSYPIDIYKTKVDGYVKLS